MVGTKSKTRPIADISRQSRSIARGKMMMTCRRKTNAKASNSVTKRWIFYVLITIYVMARECCAQRQQQMQNQPQTQQHMQQQIQQMQQQIQQMQTAVRENPRNSEARFQLAWAMITTQGMSPQAFQLIKSCFDSNQVDTPLQELVQPMMTFVGAHLLARWEKESKDSREAQKYFRLAYEASKPIVAPEGTVGEICTHLQLATELDSYPLSNQDVDDSVAKMEEWANSLIDLLAVQKHKDAYLRTEWMGPSMPGFAKDPYVHCALTLFPLSFYYRADVAKIANLHYQVSTLVFPKLLYTAQHVKEFEKLQEQKRAKLSSTGEAPSESPIIQSCVDRKIKLGVISSVLSEGHSVSEDFGGILQRLDRSIFDVSYHYLHEQSTPADAAAFLTANPSDKLYHYTNQPEIDFNDGAWVRRYGQDIEKFEFDIILYLDLTMGSHTRRLGMERLAPVQLNTHGHPLTSGIPRNTIQHFVSWGEAELPLEESQTHYTEQLQLIPKGKIHQYYTPRLETDQDGKRISRMDQQPFDHLTRKDFEQLSEFLRNSSPQDESIHLYTCMQKPFKVFPEFDELLCGILQRDPQGHAILHKETQTGHTNIFVQRLITAGCDMDRVHFVSPQPPHRLMALYQISTVILDSYPAGGCTTSREVMELGKAIVTWPARLLGGRWTLGLYKTIGLDEDTQNQVIANSQEEYIAKAVALGTNTSLRKSVEHNILKAVPMLFGRLEAVEEWEKILLKVSPVKQCIDDTTGEKEDRTNDEL